MSTIAHRRYARESCCHCSLERRVLRLGSPGSPAGWWTTHSQAAVLADLGRFPRHVPGPAWDRQPRRMPVYADDLLGDGFTTLNETYTAGSHILDTAMLPSIWNIMSSYRFGTVATVDDPLGPRELADVGNVVPAAKALLHTALPPNPVDPSAFELHYPHTAQRLEKRGTRNVVAEPQEPTTLVTAPWDHWVARAHRGFEDLPGQGVAWSPKARAIPPGCDTDRHLDLAPAHNGRPVPAVSPSCFSGPRLGGSRLAQRVVGDGGLVRAAQRFGSGSHCHTLGGSFEAQR